MSRGSVESCQVVVPGLLLGSYDATFPRARVARGVTHVLSVLEARVVLDPGEWPFVRKYTAQKLVRVSDDPNADLFSSLGAACATTRGLERRQETRRASALRGGRVALGDRRCGICDAESAR
jgi:hypothetical protein